MAIEIERKFLVKGDSWRGLGKAIHYRQGYIRTENHATVRVRIAGDRGYLTLKTLPSGSSGIRRLEYEYPIPLEDAQEMLEYLCDRPQIDKTRYTFNWGGMVWEVDEFAGDNQGLILAEVELTDANQEIQLPEWVGEEVSEDYRYFNSYLASHPYSQWKS
ncbi:CYTH domain-containing protein [Roseofilum capinflatum]|uniref:CYTH domain-containing protein n=1 Tax=Roseofilum capinflatum BLCC-M114 TaxID=3022440 RepID=A0ABT7B7T8_9CYAN|nr:CYTH domain-containing protein [Roseofilum capinflatum]MDJ1174353.1 CYTH domain-containing protein [Roseofilum capinflatum BLCC-M114]